MPSSAYDSAAVESRATTLSICRVGVSRLPVANS